MKMDCTQDTYIDDTPDSYVCACMPAVAHRVQAAQAVPAAQVVLQLAALRSAVYCTFAHRVVDAPSPVCMQELMPTR